jgi:hypothetical protein
MSGTLELTSPTGHPLAVNCSRSCLPSVRRPTIVRRKSDPFCTYGKDLAMEGPKRCVRASGILFQSQIAARYREFSGFSSKAFSPEGVQ